MVVVPRSSKQIQSTLDTHRAMGHLGAQRVLDRLQRTYWWHGMGDTAPSGRVMHVMRVKKGSRKSSKEL